MKYEICIYKESSTYLSHLYIFSFLVFINVHAESISPKLTIVHKSHLSVFKNVWIILHVEK